MSNVAPINSRTATSVDEALLQIANAKIPPGVTRVAVVISVSNDVAMDQFEVRGKVGDTEITLASAGADFTSPAGIVVDASGDLTALAANTTGWVLLDVRGLTDLVLYGACAVGGPSTLTVDLFSDTPG